MLQKLRDQTGSWIAKAILGLLILSFGAWGIADYATGGRGANVAAEVGDREISITELDRRYRSFLQQQNLTGVDEDTARQLNLVETVLQRMIGQALFDAEAKELGLSASDRSVRESIQSRPEFTNAIGDFDRQRLQQILSFQGMSEREYFESVRSDQARQQLIAAIVGGTAAPPHLLDALHAYQGERRSAAYLRLPVDEAADVGTPTENELTTYYEENKDSFRQPQLREITYVMISPDAVAKDIPVQESEIREAYEARQDEFTSPERRTLSQMLFQDQAQAEKAWQKLQDGVNFKAVAEEYSSSDADTVELGTFRRSEIPDPAMAETAFSLAPGSVSEPFEGAFGWSIVKVTDVDGGSVTPYAEVKDRIRRDLALDRATDEVFERSKVLEDVLGEGGTLEEAAEAIGIDAKHVGAVDRQGNGPDGDPLDSLPASVTFLEVAFDTPENEVSFPETTENNGILVLRVDSVTEAMVPPLAEIRPQVEEAWKSAARRDTAEAQAEKLAGRFSSETDLTEYATETGLEAGRIERFNRSGLGDSGARIPGTLASSLFEAAPGTTDYAFADGEYIVAVLSDVIPAGEAADDGFKQTLADSMVNRMTRDLIEQYGAALRNRHSIETNPDAVDRIY